MPKFTYAAIDTAGATVSAVGAARPVRVARRLRPPHIVWASCGRAAQCIAPRPLVVWAAPPSRPAVARTTPARTLSCACRAPSHPRRQVLSPPCVAAHGYVCGCCMRVHRVLCDTPNAAALPHHTAT